MLCIVSAQSDNQSDMDLWSRRYCCMQRAGNPRRPKATPLPWRSVLVLFFLVFAGQFATLLIFPLLPFMIHDFFPHLSKQSLGKKAGYLGSAYYIGNSIGGPVWGWVSDSLGRRPVLLCGAFCILISQLLFGFSRNFAWAVGARLMWGILDGNVGVAKAYLSEVCDDTNQAQAFSILTASVGLGRLFGSLAGGFLAQPAKKYSTFQVPFFCKFPFLLPYLVGASIMLISFVLTYLLLPATAQKRKRREGRDEEETDTSELSTLEASGLALELTAQGNSDPEIDSEPEPLKMMESDIDSQTDPEEVTSDVELLVQRRPRSKHCPGLQNPLPSLITMKGRFFGCRVTNSSCRSEPSVRIVVQKKLFSMLVKLKGLLLLMRDKGVLISTSLYGFVSFAAIIGTTVFPLLLVTDYEYGGYDLDDSEIGVILMVAAVSELLCQVLVFPRIVKLLGYRRTFQLTVFLFGLTTVLLPLANKMTGPLSESSEGSGESSGWLSGSASGSHFSLEENSTSEPADFCGRNSTEDQEAHDDTVTRVPFKIWITLSLLYASIATFRIASLTTLIVLVSNSTVPKFRGSVNGIGQAVASFGRAVGPIVGALLFAWSEDNGLGWPLNYHFAFELIAMCLLIALGTSLLLPKRIERQKK